MIIADGPRNLGNRWCAHCRVQTVVICLYVTCCCFCYRQYMIRSLSCFHIIRLRCVAMHTTICMTCEQGCSCNQACKSGQIALDNTQLHGLLDHRAARIGALLFQAKRSDRLLSCLNACMGNMHCYQPMLLLWKHLQKEPLAYTTSPSLSGRYCTKAI